MAIGKPMIQKSRSEEVFNKLNESKTADEMFESKRVDDITDDLSNEMDLIQLTIRLDKIAMKKLLTVARKMGASKSMAVRYAVNKFVEEFTL